MRCSREIRDLRRKFVVFVCESRCGAQILVLFVAKLHVLVFGAIRTYLGAFLALHKTKAPEGAPSYQPELFMVNTQVIESRRELNAIYEVSKTLATSLDVSKTFREALNYLLHAFDWRRAFVVLNEADGRLGGMCAVGLTREEQQRLQFQSSEGIVGRVFTNGIQVLVPDVRAEPLFLNRTGGADQSPGVPVAMMVTPIRADRHTIGVLAVDCLNPDEKRGFSNDLQLLKMVATLMGQALLLHRTVSNAHDSLQDEVRRMQKGQAKPGKQLPQVDK